MASLKECAAKFSKALSTRDLKAIQQIAEENGGDEVAAVLTHIQNLTNPTVLNQSPNFTSKILTTVQEMNLPEWKQKKKIPDRLVELREMNIQATNHEHYREWEMLEQEYRVEAKGKVIWQKLKNVGSKDEREFL